MTFSSKTKHTGMSASSIRIDRPAESVAPSGHVIQRRAGVDLVKVDPHRLRGVEGADDGAVAYSRQAQILLDSLLIPSHTNICSHALRGKSNLGGALVLLGRDELVEPASGLAPGLLAQGRQHCDQIAHRAERLLGP